MFSATCDQGELHQKVQLVARGVTQRSTHPAQSNIFMQVRETDVGYRLYLAATDLEYIAVNTHLDIEDGAEGAVTVPASILVETIGKLAADTVTLKANEDDKIEIRGGRFKSTVQGLPADDFEQLGDLSDAVEFEMSYGDMAGIIKRTLFATSTDETRPILTGALFKIEKDVLTVVATDTYRLAVCTHTFPVHVVDELEAIVARRLLSEAMRILKTEDDTLKVRISDTQVEFTIGDVVLGSRLINGQFVNYPRVIPTSHDNKASLDVAQLIETLKRANAVARHDANRVTFEFSDTWLNVSAESRDMGSCNEKLVIQYEGKPLEIAFNNVFVQDMLSVCGDTSVTIELGEALGAGVFKPVDDDSYLYVAMPMQVY